MNPDVRQNVTRVAREAIQRKTGLEAVASWEKQHGRFGADEMTQARRNVRAQLRASETVGSRLLPSSD